MIVLGLTSFLLVEHGHLEDSDLDSCRCPASDYPCGSEYSPSPFKAVSSAPKMETITPALSSSHMWCEVVRTYVQYSHVKSPRKLHNSVTPGHSCLQWLSSLCFTWCVYVFP